MDDKSSTWQWILYIVFFVLFPVVLRPWWLGIISIAVFGVVAYMLHPKNQDPK